MMMGIHALGSVLIWVLSTLCLTNVSLGFFDPLDNYLIDCGSRRNESVGDRVFLADQGVNSAALSTPQNIFVNTTTSKSISTSLDVALYQTARVLSGSSHYTFSIKHHGCHWIRLHFFPFVDGKHNLSMAKFSVSAQNFTLLRDFQPQNGAVVKEYCLNITSDNLVLSFTPAANSFAFLNALEVLSLPDGLIPAGATTVDPPVEYQSFLSRAMETVARVNMGNQTVSPQNDSLWRLWVSDKPFLNHVNLVTVVSNIRAVNYSRKWPSRDVAPPSVYGTGSRLNSQNDPHFTANATWSFHVDPGFEYLVRLHFCDIVSSSPKQLFFNVYIDSCLAMNLDLSNVTSNIFGAPYYADFVTRSSKNGALSVSIGPSNLGTSYPDGILNGLEILKLSNSKGSLAVESKTSSKNKVWMILGVGIGVSLVAAFLAASLLIICTRRRRKRRRRRSSVLDDHSTEDHSGINGVGSSPTTTMVNNYVIGTCIISSSKTSYRFPFAAIREATNNFSHCLVIGAGGFGKVYKGVLRDGTKVAVKRGSSQSQQGLSEFHTEIEMLSQFRHRHLVSLIGYCHEQNEMIIVYEYMENGTLKSHLYGSDLPGLSWTQRLDICIGSARGLHYLHTGSAKPIIHRDVKSANILLDENLMAKVADFGLSKTGPEIDETHVSTAVKGSFGYLDPEYLLQESKLCAVHCVNTVLQGPFFSEFDLAALASDLDRTERQMMVEGGGGAAAQGFLSEESHNVSLDGDFSIQVLQKALEVWDLQVIPLNSTDAGPAQVDPELENAFICHLQDHWFCIRKVNGEWYNFDSLYAAPEHLSKFYLSAYLDSLRGFGWSIFLVRGNFPKECPITSSEASNVYGQWLTPEDAERITKSCNSVQGPPRRTNPNPQPSNPNPEEQLLIDEEDEDLKAAIAASLMDSADAAIPQGENKNSSQENA